MRLPQDPRQARIWNFLNSGEDFFPIRDWPDYLQTLQLKQHRVNRERFTLFFFLAANGLDPEVAAQWTLLNDVIHGRLITRGYDYQAHRQVQQLITQHTSGSLYSGRKRIYDMNAGRPTIF